MRSKEQSETLQAIHHKCNCRQVIQTVMAMAGVLFFMGLACAGQKSSSAYPPDLEPFLKSYFSSWSAGNFKAYEAHFHRNARIYYVNSQRSIEMDSDLKTFIAQQIEVRANASARLSEKMTKFSGNVDDRAASLETKWELLNGSSKRTGIDRFTLIRDESGKWKILSLLFYEDKK